jgi:hypothetical protein
MTLEQAVKRIVPKCKDKRDPVWSACYFLNQAIVYGHVKLTCNGNEVAPGFFSSHFHIVCDDDGGDVRLQALRALVKPVHEYRWEIVAAGLNKVVRNYEETRVSMGLW